MKKVRITGVPEHFNYPFHLAIQEGAFEAAGIELHWTDVPEGTGRMTDMLREGETDMALMLTEGTLRAAGMGVPLKIIQVYVQSPLLWGVHTGLLQDEPAPPLSEAQIAISRFGSGSHLMAKVMGLQQGIELKKEQFVIVQHLSGALEYLKEQPGTYFMWEHFTTNPYVEQGLLERQYDFPTPWPCFLWVAQKEHADKNAGVISSMQRILSRYTEEFKSIPSIEHSLANAYGLELEQVQKWLSLTEWSQSAFQPTEWNKVQDILLSLDVLDKPMIAEDYIWNPT
ncbi:ABC transporter substrate-binding protein [Aureicoccus marinus]|uniref:Uncharacterized protein n=1 Tax=Aureicoccus marinus TaxID=754435 RepID=A0A2S7T5W2_9FLAO|nr:ABC transporter substrate-binding protein [Aureicoccus marinus]PQJ14988.1 hypothetical protein BST99_03885 [Aureicoccus marinus]